MLTLEESEKKDSERATLLGSSILERVGNTPLVRLERLTAQLDGIQILGKAEWANPGGSVKDRAAKAIVLDAMKRGWIGGSETGVCWMRPAAIPELHMRCWARP